MTDLFLESGKLTFAEYMDHALYDLEYGYYTSGDISIGKRGDFFTSVSLGADFGELLALQLFECWQKLGSRSHFALVEMGAGSGQLAVDILNYLSRKQPEFYQTISYYILEISPQLLAKQQHYINSHLLESVPIIWSDWSQLPKLTGCFFSNELVDAFPVHQIVIESGQLKEVYVNCQQGKFQESLEKPSTDELLSYFQMLDIDILSYPDGYRSEVNLQAKLWLENIAQKLETGYLITIDYGYDARRYYHIQRNAGTLQCYYKQKRHSDPYLYLGKQDITASVNFTALERWGTELGLELVGVTKQALFLMSLGLGDRLNELSSGCYNVSDLLKKRDALHQLIDPVGLGNLQVLIQSKNTDQSIGSLQGFRDPYT